MGPLSGMSGGSGGSVCVHVHVCIHVCAAFNGRVSHNSLLWKRVGVQQAILLSIVLWTSGLCAIRHGWLGSVDSAEFPHVALHFPSTPSCVSSICISTGLLPPE